VRRGLRRGKRRVGDEREGEKGVWGEEDSSRSLEPD